MHKDFAEWYRLAGIEPDGDLLPKRWAAIENYGPEASDILSLTKLFYKIDVPTDEFLESFRSAFQTEDPAFKMRDNDHELSVLAGAELVDVMARSNDLDDLAALTLVCAAASNLRPGPCVRDIPEIAARHLTDRTAERWSTANEEQATGSNESLFAALKAQPAPSPDVAKFLRQQQRELALVREESNILWWLFSEHSRQVQQPWSSLPPAAIPLMAGKELADLTQVIPGPIAARAFLDKVIRSGKGKAPATINVTDSINEVSLTWRQDVAKEYGTPVLEAISPIIRGIHISLGAPKDNAWVPVFTQSTNIPGTAKLAPSVLAHQVFYESMLYRLWKRVSA